MSYTHTPIHAKVSAWLKANRSALLDLGLPLCVLENPRNWQLFLEDGSFASASTLTPDIDVDALPLEQADRILRFLSQHFPDRSESGTSPYRAVNRLEAILKRGVHAV
jgi:hypothetical protein